MSTYLEQAEDNELFREKKKTQINKIFSTIGSAGRNSEQLARILVAFDTTINMLGWQEKPIANLTHFLTQYQASVDAKYHNDFKDVLIAEEIERRRSERKGISILQQ